MQCVKRKNSGSSKRKRTWLIPDDAEKPLDGRISTGKYSRKRQEKRKTLPVGISDYVRAQSEYYYVDKTLLIKEFLDRKPLVSLFTRPRRFGKTLNMDMLRVFLKYQRMIPASISRIKQFGNVAKNIADIRKISGYFLNLQRCKIRYVGSNHRQNPRITSGRIWEASGITEQ